MESERYEKFLESLEYMSNVTLGETKDLSEMSKEELISELLRVEKINSGIVDTTHSFIVTEYLIYSYPQSKDKKFEQRFYNTTNKFHYVTRELSSYYNKLVREVGKKLTLSEQDIVDLENKVYEREL